MEQQASQRSPIDVLIVGAGISGLMAGQVLARAGKSICVLDKGRGVGGRMATRRRCGGAVFDHGAQFFTVRDARFQGWVDEWCALGLVKPWYDLDGSGRHFRGEPGMTAIAKQLSRDLDVRRDHWVESVAFVDGRWVVRVKGGSALTSRYLLLTAPVPQSLALLDAGNVLVEASARCALDAVRYHRCIAALVVLDRSSAIVAYDGALKLDGEPIQWIADNQRKGISPEVPTVTIHSTPAFAEAHWETEDAVRLPLLLEAAAEHLQAKVLSCHGHRWGFSQPVGRYHEEAFVDAKLRLAMAGDGLAGGRIEGAALSGLASGRALVALMERDLD